MSSTRGCTHVCQLAPEKQPIASGITPQPCPRDEACVLVDPGIGICFALCTSSRDCALGSVCTPIINGTLGPSACASSTPPPTGSGSTSEFADAGVAKH
ncbi:MAG: hypothetical protein ACHREM_29950 [Polyangiales bacterium]